MAWSSYTANSAGGVMVLPACVQYRLRSMQQQQAVEDARDREIAALKADVADLHAELAALRAATTAAPHGCNAGWPLPHVLMPPGSGHALVTTASRSPGMCLLLVFSRLKMLRARV
jgi:hypothetical protein